MSDVNNTSVERALIPISSPREHLTAQQRAAARVRQAYGTGESDNRTRQDSVTLSGTLPPGVAAAPAATTSTAATASINDTPQSREQVRATYAHPQTSIDPAPTPGSLINIRV